MSILDDRETSAEGWLVAAVGLLVGPAAAGLHESGILSFGPPATLWPIAFVAVAAAAGVVTGVLLASRLSRLVGAVVAAPNLVVLAFYGFLLLFFGLGGSR